MHYYSRFIESCGLQSPPEIALGSDILRLLRADLFDTKHTVLLLWDPETSAAVQGSLSEEEFSARGHVVRLLPHLPVPSLDLVAEIAREAVDRECSLILAVGSGVISDLGKHAAMKAGIENWCCMTAASVDAFTSGTAAIRVEGYHESLPTRPAERIYADLDVLRNSPLRMSLSGLGDLTAKFIDAADWKLGAQITGEAYDPRVADFSVGSAELALKNLSGILEGSGDAFAVLADAVLTSGMNMRFQHSSRPASSAEHTLAHYWEMAGLVGNREWDLHGVLVAASSRVICRAYREILNLCTGREPDFARRLETLESERKSSPAELFSGSVLQKVERELRSRDLSPEGLAARQEKLLAFIPQLEELYEPLLRKAEKALDELEDAGLPLDIDTLGIPREQGWFGLQNIRELRNRYGLINAACDLGFDRETEAILKAAYDASFSEKE